MALVKAACLSLERLASGSVVYLQGDYDEATALFQRAVSGAEAALSGATDADAAPPLLPWAVRETHASALGGLGQAAMLHKDWDKAEEILSQV